MVGFRPGRFMGGVYELSGEVPLEDSERTRFTSDGLNIGWVTVVSRSAIVKRFGHVFGFVDLTDKQFQGFEFYGFAERPYAGTPACVLSLPRTEQRPLAGWFRRPSDRSGRLVRGDRFRPRLEASVPLLVAIESLDVLNLADVP